MSANLTGLGFFNKPRYGPEVLIGNWYEDRMLREPMRYHYKTEKPENLSVTVQNPSAGEGTREGSSPQHAAGVGADGPSYSNNLTNYGRPAHQHGQNSSGRTYSFAELSSNDLLRDKYNTVYDRSYGRLRSNLHLNHYPTLPLSRSSTSTQQQGGGGGAGKSWVPENDCVRCKQLYHS